MEEITIPMEEYKELLLIKGKYQELKEQQRTPVIWSEPTLTRTLYGTNQPLPENPNKVYCGKE